MPPPGPPGPPPPAYQEFLQKFELPSLLDFYCVHLSFRLKIGVSIFPFISIQYWHSRKSFEKFVLIINLRLELKS